MRDRWQTKGKKMKKNIYLIVFLMLGLWADDSVCQKFLDPEMRKLMVIPLPKGEKSISVDINNDGIEENISMSFMGGNMPTERIDIFNQQNNKLIDIEMYENSRFSRSMQILLDEGHYYIVYFANLDKKSPTYIVSINDKNIEQPVCKFKTTKKLKLVEHNSTYSSKKCDTLLNMFEEGKTVPFTIVSEFPSEDICTKYRHTFHHCRALRVGGIGYLDYDNDGKKEYVQKLFNKFNERDNYYAVIDDKKTLRMNTLMMHRESWIEKNGKTYYLNGHFKYINYPPSIGMIDNHNSKQVCRYDYDIVTSLDKNITK